MATILIIDDDAPVRQFLATLLGCRGHRIVEAADGYQGLSVFHVERPDLILIDLVMPVMDGFAFLRDLRASRHGRSTPVIIHTAMICDEKTHGLARACGARWVLEKPSQPWMILDAVDQALSSPPVQVQVPVDFERDHLQLFVTQLTRKVDELQEEIARRERTKAELCASEQRYRSLVQALAQIVWRTDHEGKVLEVSPAFEAYTGIAPWEAGSWNWHEAIHPDDREDAVLAWQRAGAERRLFAVEYRLQVREGGYRDFQVRGVPILADDGSIREWVGVGNDVTEYKKADQALRESEERFRVALKNSPIVVFRQDRDLRYIWVDNSHLGYFAADCLGKTDDDLLPPEESGPLTAIKRRVLESGVGSRQEVVLHPRGAVASYDLTVEPLRDAAGAVVGITCAAMDVTASKALQAERLRLLERLRLQIDRLPLAFLQMDADFRVLDWNPAAEKMFGYSREEALGRVALDLILPDPVPESVQEVNRRLRTGDMNASHINENRTRDGRLITCEWFNTPLTAPDGRFLGVISLAQDITERRRAEENLRRSEALLEEAERLAGLGSWEWHPLNNTAIWSRELSAIFGIQPDQFGGTFEAFLERVHPDDREAIKASNERALREHLPFEYSYRIRRPDGAVRTLHACGQVGVGADGKAVRLSGACQDITERKQAEEALRQSEEQVRLLLNSTAEAIYGLDADGRCTFCNSACIRLLGYADPQDLLGADMHRLIHHTRPDGTPYPREECHIYQAFLRGQGTHVEDEVLWRADGVSFPAEYRSYPIRRGEQVIGVVVTFLDISERRRAEDELRTLNAALENAVEGIALVDAQGRFQSVNRAYAEMLGYQPEELVGMNWQPTVHPQDLEKVEAAHRRMQIEGRGEVDVLGVRKDHSVFWKQTVLVKAQDRQGRWRGHYRFTKDVSLRKQAEEVLEKYNARLQALSRRLVEFQEDERRHLARELHDEIGQVLSAISVNLKVVRGKVDPAAWPRLEESIGLVDRAVDQVRNLSLDLRPSVLDDFGLEAALRWYVDRLAKRTGLQAHFTAESALLDVPSAVRSACYRLAQEALTNVVRHARAGEVWVHFHEGEGEVRLEVRDDGVGFEVADALQRAQRGGSLGLLGMQERVELLGGRVDIESLPGHGTTVRACLPLAGNPQPDEPSEKGHEP
jgi:PAS domain S-box-containing protein